MEAYERKEGTQEEIAIRFSVGIASVKRWWSSYRSQGHVEPQPMGGDRRSKVTEERKNYLRLLLSDESTWNTQELSEEMEDAFAEKISPRTYGRTLKKMGYTFKRGSFVHER